MSERILIIDDDPDIVRFVEASLSMDGYEVRSAGDARSGIDAALSDPPDLVLLDVMMPDIDGFEVLQRLKTSPASANVAIVLLTARANVRDLVRDLAIHIPQPGAQQWCGFRGFCGILRDLGPTLARSAHARARCP